jgi:hypothetical protein
MEPASDTYNVHAAWESGVPIAETTLTALGASLQPDDESFCFWVDEADPRRVLASWNVPALSIEDAARQCRAALLPLEREPDFVASLAEIGVSTDDGYWTTSDPERDIPV